MGVCIASFSRYFYVCVFLIALDPSFVRFSVFNLSLFLHSSLLPCVFLTSFIIIFKYFLIFNGYTDCDGLMDEVYPSSTSIEMQLHSNVKECHFEICAPFRWRYKSLDAYINLDEMQFNIIAWTAGTHTQWLRKFVCVCVLKLHRFVSITHRNPLVITMTS